MLNISICVCTRKRQNGLIRLLESLEKMDLPSDSNVKIIIVENDEKNYSESIVKEISARSRYEINYFLESRQGLAYARNRSVSEAVGSDFCCFVDDDQTVSPVWLTELTKCQKEFDADGVSGPNPPVFNEEVPSYIRQFHTPKCFEYGAVVKTAFTNNLLIKKKYLDQIDGPFDTRLNFTGGEDSYMTSLISDLGGVIRYNPLAVAYEIVADNRTAIKYVLQRTFRISNAGLVVKSMKDKNFKNHSALPRLLMRFVYGLLISLPCFIFGGEERLNGLIKVANAVGGFSFIFGRHNQFYK